MSSTEILIFIFMLVIILVYSLYTMRARYLERNIKYVDARIDDLLDIFRQCGKRLNEISADMDRLTERVNGHDNGIVNTHDEIQAVSFRIDAFKGQCHFIDNKLSTHLEELRVSAQTLSNDLYINKHERIKDISEYVGKTVALIDENQKVTYCDVRVKSVLGQSTHVLYDKVTGKPVYVDSVFTEVYPVTNAY